MPAKRYYQMERRVTCPLLWNKHMRITLKFPRYTNTYIFLTVHVYRQCIHLHEESHDDVIKWKHFLRYWPFVREIHWWFPSQRPATRTFDIFFDLRLNKRLSEQSKRWLFETPSHYVLNSLAPGRCASDFKSTISEYILRTKFMSISGEIALHYSNVIMSTISSQITGVAIVYSIVGSGADQRIHQSSASLVFVRGVHRWLVNSPHKGPVTRKMFPFDDVIMQHDSRWSTDSDAYKGKYLFFRISVADD